MNKPDWFDVTNTKQDVLEGIQYAPWLLKILSFAEFENLSASDKLLYLSCYGVLAPTTHNSVPERFTISAQKNELTVLLDRKYVLSQSDKDGREACISIGCVALNIQRAAWSYGLQFKTVLMQTSVDVVRPMVDESQRYTPLFSLHITKGKNPHTFSWLQAMVSRKVVRAEYNNTIPINQSIITDIQQSVMKQSQGVMFHCISDKAQIYELAKLQEMADRKVFEEETFSMELGSWFLPDHHDTPVGMRGRDFGLDAAFTQRLHDGLLKKERLFPDEIAAFALAGKILMKSSPAIGVISIESDTIENWVSAGKVYQEIALILQMHGLVTAFHAGMVEVKRVNRMLAVALRTKQIPTIVFRIGKPLNENDMLRPHSTRPFADDLLII